MGTPQVHGNLDVYLPLKLTGAGWLSPPVQKHGLPLAALQGEEPEASGGQWLGPQAFRNAGV